MKEEKGESYAESAGFGRTFLPLKSLVPTRSSSDEFPKISTGFAADSKSEIAIGRIKIESDVCPILKVLKTDTATIPDKSTEWSAANLLENGTVMNIKTESDDVPAFITKDLVLPIKYAEFESALVPNLVCERILMSIKKEPNVSPEREAFEIEDAPLSVGSALSRSSPNEEFSLSYVKTESSRQFQEMKSCCVLLPERVKSNTSHDERSRDDEVFMSSTYCDKVTKIEVYGSSTHDENPINSVTHNLVPFKIENSDLTTNVAGASMHKKKEYINTRLSGAKNEDSSCDTNNRATYHGVSFRKERTTSSAFDQTPNRGSVKNDKKKRPSKNQAIEVRNGVSDDFNPNRGAICRRKVETRTTNSIRNIVTRDEGTGMHRCNLCLKLFARRCNAWTHLKYSCGKVAKTEIKSVGASFGYVNRTPEFFNGVEKERPRCTKCEKYFSRPDSLKKHLKTVHERPEGPERIFKCEECSKTYGSRSYFITHLTRHRRWAETDRRVCSVCRESFTDSYSFSSHMRWAHRAGPTVRSQPCQGCGTSFSRISCLSKHLKRPGIKNFPFASEVLTAMKEQLECRSCGKVFSEEAFLKCHLVYRFRNAEQVCQLCCAFFKEPEELNDHYRSEHRNDRCRLERGQGQRNTLSVANLGAPYSCHHCGSAFQKKGLLLNHIHKRCFVAFVSGVGAEAYFGRKRPTRRFVCFHCEGSFTAKHKLTKHIFRHCPSSAFKK